MGRLVWAGCIALSLAACAGSTPSTVQPLYRNGVLQTPLSTATAESLLRRAGPRYETCYRREMLNLNKSLSNYVFIVWIPTDGSGADVEVEKATIKGQTTLRECLEEAIQDVPFPAHTGQPIELRVPVKGPA